MSVRLERLYPVGSRCFIKAGPPHEGASGEVIAHEIALGRRALRIRRADTLEEFFVFDEEHLGRDQRRSEP